MFFLLRKAKNGSISNWMYPRIVFIESSTLIFVVRRKKNTPLKKKINKAIGLDACVY